MRSMDSRDLDQAVAEMVRVLAPHGEADWGRSAGTLDWSCRQTAAHVAHDLLAYAGQLAVRPDSAYLPFDLVVREELTGDYLHADQLTSQTTWFELLDGPRLARMLAA